MCQLSFREWCALFSYTFLKLYYYSYGLYSVMFYFILLLNQDSHFIGSSFYSVFQKQWIIGKKQIANTKGDGACVAFASNFISCCFLWLFQISMTLMHVWYSYVFSSPLMFCSPMLLSDCFPIFLASFCFLLFCCFLFGLIFLSYFQLLRLLFSFLLFWCALFISLLLVWALMLLLGCFVIFLASCYFLLVFVFCFLMVWSSFVFSALFSSLLF